MKSEQKLSQTRSQQNLAFEFLTTVVTSSYCNNPKTSLPLTNLMTPPSYLNMVTQKPIRRPSGGRLRSAADADVTISTVYRQHVIFRACYCAKKNHLFWANQWREDSFLTRKHLEVSRSLKIVRQGRLFLTKLSMLRYAQTGPQRSEMLNRQCDH